MSRKLRSVVVVITLLVIGSGQLGVLAQDTTPPVISNISFTLETINAGENVNVTFTITDNVGFPVAGDTFYNWAFAAQLEKVSGTGASNSPWTNIGTPINPNTKSLTLSTAGLNGVYRVKVSSIDAANNVTTIEDAGRVHVDGGASPTISDVSISPAAMQPGGVVSVTFTIADDTGFELPNPWYNWAFFARLVKVSGSGAFDTPWAHTVPTGGGTDNPSTSTLALSTTDLEGTYEVHTGSIDSAGNLTEVTTGRVTVDGTPPKVIITHPKDGDITSASINVNGSATDNVSNITSVDVAMNSTTFDVVDGEFGDQLVDPLGIDITVTAVDDAGNVGTDTVTIIRRHDFGVRGKNAPYAE